MAGRGGDSGSGGLAAAVSREVFDPGETRLRLAWGDAWAEAAEGADPAALADAVAVAGFCRLLVGRATLELCDPTYREVGEAARRALDPGGEASALDVVGVRRVAGDGARPAFPPTLALVVAPRGAGGATGDVVADDLVEDHVALAAALREGRPLDARETCLAACLGVGRFRFVLSDEPPTCRVGRWRGPPNEVLEDLEALPVRPADADALLARVVGALAANRASPRPTWDGTGPRPLDAASRDHHVRLVERAPRGLGGTGTLDARDLAVAECLGVGRYLAHDEAAGTVTMLVGPPGGAEARVVPMPSDPVALDAVSAMRRLREAFPSGAGWRTEVDASERGSARVRISRRGRGPWAVASARAPLATVVVQAMVSVLGSLAASGWPPTVAAPPGPRLAPHTVLVRDAIDGEVMSLHVTGADADAAVEAAYLVVREIDGDDDGPATPVAMARIRDAYPLVATYAGHVESLAGRVTARRRGAA